MRGFLSFLKLMKAILNFAIAFEKEYNEKLVTSRILSIVKDMLDSDFLTGISIQSYYRYIRVAATILMHESVLSLVEGLNGDGGWSKRLRIFQLDDVGLHMATMKGLPIFITAASNFMKIPNKPAPFHALIFYTSAKTILGKLNAVFVYRYSSSALEFVDYRQAALPYAHYEHSPLAGAFQLHLSARL